MEVTKPPHLDGQRVDAVVHQLLRQLQVIIQVVLQDGGGGTVWGDDEKEITWSKSPFS